MTHAEAAHRISQLSEQINYHNELYYQQHRTEISDYAFDSLLAELEKFLPSVGVITDREPAHYHSWFFLPVRKLLKFDTPVTDGKWSVTTPTTGKI
jgi:hypothetical protein